MNDSHLKTWTIVGLVYVVVTSTIAMLAAVWLFLNRPDAELLNARISDQASQTELARRDRDLARVEIDSLRLRLDSLHAITSRIETRIDATVAGGELGGAVDGGGE